MSDISGPPAEVDPTMTAPDSAVPVAVGIVPSPGAFGMDDAGITPDDALWVSPDEAGALDDQSMPVDNGEAAEEAEGDAEDDGESLLSPEERGVREYLSDPRRATDAVNALIEGVGEGRIQARHGLVRGEPTEQLDQEKAALRSVAQSLGLKVGEFGKSGNLLGEAAPVEALSEDELPPKPTHQPDGSWQLPGGEVISEAEADQVFTAHYLSRLSRDRMEDRDDGLEDLHRRSSGAYPEMIPVSRDVGSVDMERLEEQLHAIRYVRSLTGSHNLSGDVFIEDAGNDEKDFVITFRSPDVESAIAPTELGSDRMSISAAIERLSGQPETPETGAKPENAVESTGKKRDIDPSIRLLASSESTMTDEERDTLLQLAIKESSLDSLQNRVIVTGSDGNEHWGAEHPNVFSFNGGIRGLFDQVPKDATERDGAMQATFVLGGEAVAKGSFTTVIFELDDGEQIAIKRTNERVSSTKQTFQLSSTSHIRSESQAGRHASAIDLDTSMLDGVVVVPGESLVLGRDPESGKRIRSRGKVVKITTVAANEEGVVPPNHPYLTKKPELRRDAIGKFNAAVRQASQAA